MRNRQYRGSCSPLGLLSLSSRHLSLHCHNRPHCCYRRRSRTPPRTPYPSHDHLDVALHVRALHIRDRTASLLASCHPQVISRALSPGPRSSHFRFADLPAIHPSPAGHCVRLRCSYDPRRLSPLKLPIASSQLPLPPLAPSDVFAAFRSPPSAVARAHGFSAPPWFPAFRLSFCVATSSRGPASHRCPLPTRRIPFRRRSSPWKPRGAAGAVAQTGAASQPVAWTLVPSGSPCWPASAFAWLA
mmetsp:Transcript_6752/g.26109  ORF Transcript_6752/g.26109 Transcript_6752/m.26109 type:complete len:244 (-) Transcript_6752:540-1271(-)